MVVVAAEVGLSGRGEELEVSKGAGEGSVEINARSALVFKTIGIASAILPQGQEISNQNSNKPGNHIWFLEGYRERYRIFLKIIETSINWRQLWTVAARSDQVKW
ncbi:hypothetical protein PVK06_001190 [Gossypium arboreum]|uniref:Uncharacterized protein n=1 Tax=Gossypium arboreum TaxID=29729 RepID=A0ABR0R0D9_GOSAR|nr:hypothetical protein PVK06_001190 [Gossypium arboreum]